MDEDAYRMLMRLRVSFTWGKHSGKSLGKGPGARAQLISPKMSKAKGKNRNRLYRTWFFIHKTLAFTPVQREISWMVT